MTIDIPEHKYETTIDALKNVIDPELSVNVWDLGLIYGLRHSESESGTHLDITMTLTTPACPLSDVIENALSTELDGVYDSLSVTWTWLPAWGAHRITEDGISMLRAVGFSL